MESYYPMPNVKSAIFGNSNLFRISKYSKQKMRVINWIFKCFGLWLWFVILFQIPNSSLPASLLVESSGKITSGFPAECLQEPANPLKTGGYQNLNLYY
ncbi:MAG: hypothetical protein AVO38_10705 [delta proteobacterium ML8_D]|nr:MAG: hypothetical protein AVO38_10705 [delta proteobacterium ML8_D]